MTGALPPLELVLYEVAVERGRHDEPGDMPLVDQILRDRPYTRMALEYEIPTAVRAAVLVQLAREAGELTWAHRLVMHLSVFVGVARYAHLDAADARAELVRLAATAVAAIEAIDAAADGSLAIVEVPPDA